MNIIELESVHKRFRRDTTGGGRRLRHVVERVPRQEVWALRGIDLDVAQGEALGLIGGNGSGKSTALRMMAGISRPTSGRVDVRGDVSGLLTLGEGLQPLLSGEENALTGAILAGLTRREAAAQLGDIAAFAELEDELDRPLRTFSDGMRLRLAFAVAVHVHPEILLVDEVLAVGDMRFQEKCLSRLAELNHDGVTIVLTSHYMGQLARLCTRTAWLTKGEVHLVGDTEEVVERYTNAMLEAVPPGEERPDGSLRLGRQEIEIKDVRFLDGGGHSVRTLQAGAPVAVEVDYLAHQPVDDAIVSVSIHADDTGVRCLDLSTDGDRQTVGRLSSEGTMRLDLDRLDLAGGRYHLDVGFYEASWSKPYDYLWKALSFDVVAPPASGHLAPPRSWTLS